MSRIPLVLASSWLLATSVEAAPLTSVEIVPKSDWRYFYNSEDVDDTELHDALTDAGFYANWRNPGYSEPSIAGVDWKTVSG